MIIHSVVSPDDIFPVSDIGSTSLVPIKHGFVEVEGDTMRVRRLISTKPDDYLNAAYQPFCKFRL